MDKIIVKYVSKEDVEAPKYETEGAAGIDIRAYECILPNDKNNVYSIEDKIDLYPSERILIKTGLFFEIPKGYEAQVRPRSGLAWKHGITVLNTPGTVDEDYRGEIGVILLNTSKDIFTIRRGDRIAQIVFNKIEKADLVKVDKLSDTNRGEGGFGSTNK